MNTFGQRHCEITQGNNSTDFKTENTNVLGPWNCTIIANNISEYLQKTEHKLLPYGDLNFQNNILSNIRVTLRKKSFEKIIHKILITKSYNETMK